MSMREAGIARTGHTRLPTAARGARLPANQGSLVWGNHMMVLTKPLQSFVPNERGSAAVPRRKSGGELESFGETPDELLGSAVSRGWASRFNTPAGACGLAFKPSAPAK